MPLTLLLPLLFDFSMRATTCATFFSPFYTYIAHGKFNYRDWTERHLWNVGSGCSWMREASGTICYVLNLAITAKPGLMQYSEVLITFLHGKQLSGVLFALCLKANMYF